ncbi:ubiquitin thioesterase OTU1 [Cimex lectularius]|uniref:Ubiquitin thioesterase OTU n=1 Tax=Cimex lectularius TaxID=79782 RepID=A0A8I6TD03_CIMLE|nr:ubiquitin thioesterase OTU1 [Cimex lectularius]
MAKMVLRVRTKSGMNVLVDHLNPTSTLLELKEFVSAKVDIPVERMVILSGYPPRPLELSMNDITLEVAGIKSGDSLAVEDSPLPKELAASPPRRHVIDDQGSTGLLLRQVVPADNSCLFTSIGFVLGGKVDPSCGTYMRQIIAEQVGSNEDEYSEAILGKPNKDYCKWIQKPESWGGAIELAVLSNFYGMEIAVVDTMNAVINKFGEDKNYEYRVFLIFDGIHYDPLYREMIGGEMKIQTMFLRSNENALREAEELAQEAKSSRQYTDVNRFTLKCLVCREKLQGQTQAQAHAKKTGHMNFGETTS